MDADVPGIRYRHNLYASFAMATPKARKSCTWFAARSPRQHVRVSMRTTGSNEPLDKHAVTTKFFGGTEYIRRC